MRGPQRSQKQGALRLPAEPHRPGGSPMTAEIAILNKNGIALATDSKVTIGTAGQEKTFDTVNKLFTLSKVHPVGIMIYGNAEFMRYPWETIVKSYRQQKGAAEERTIVAWGEDFLSYFSKFGDIRDSDKAKNIGTILGSIFEEILDNVFAEARGKDIAVPSKDYLDLLTARLDEALATLKQKDDYFNDKQRTAFIAKHVADVSASIVEHFQSFDDTELSKKAGELALFSLFKKDFSPQSSGFVIAGFGSEEYFPALAPYETDGYVGDVLKIEKEKTTEITRDMASAIRPFAQKEMVVRFMDGIDPHLTIALQDIFTSTLTAACLDVLEKYGDQASKTDDVKTLIRKAAVAAIDSVGQTLKSIQATGFSRPIMSMVSLLPKDELPNLAESLVALTSLKRHVSRDAETVGGPIDVCLGPVLN
jgi:hypothetical protein